LVALLSRLALLAALPLASLVAAGALAELEHALHALLAALALLAEQLAQLLEALPQLLPLLVGHLLFLHAVDVLGGLLQVLGAHPQIAHQIFGGLGQVAVEAVEAALGALLALGLAVEALQLALLLLEEALVLGVGRAGVGVLLLVLLVE